MSTLKKLPWGSLALLLVTYFVFGWLLSVAHSAQVISPVVVALTLLLAGSLTSALPLVRDTLSFSLKSDSRAFVIVATVAFVSAVIVTWLQVFAHILVVISAESLARLDLQTAKFTQLQAFLILSTVSLAGLGLGAVAHIQTIVR